MPPLMNDTAKAIIEATEEVSRLLRSIDRLLLILPEDEPDVRDLAEVAYSIHAIKNQSAELFGLAEEGIGPAIPQGEEVVLANGAKVETKVGGDRKKWDHTRLGKEVARRIVDSSFDFETGEMHRSYEEMVQEVLKYAAPSYWRVGKLKEIGVDADEYCELGEPKLNIVIRRAQ